MRTSRLSRLSGAVAAATTAVLLAAPAASASAGDDGTVKIHDVVTQEELPQNEPRVCEFYLKGSGFDAEQQVSWMIRHVPPTDIVGVLVASGELALDASGEGRTDDLQLPDGRYKLSWRFDGENGEAKQKVFQVECPAEEEPEEGEPEPEDSYVPAEALAGR